MKKKCSLILLLALLFFEYTEAQTEKLYTQKEVIYGRKDGMALTMFVNTPKKTNGKALLYIASGGYFSSADWIGDIADRMSTEYFKRGYTVFVVMHGSAPFYTGEEVLSDIRKAVQFVRYNAKEYHIDPDKIGMTGTSAGGNLSCVMGATDVKSTDPNAKPEEKVSSKVQAVACFCPPTDFLNYGTLNNSVVSNEKMLLENGLKPSFTFTEYVKATNSMEVITDETKIREVLTHMSPAQLADKTTAPTFIFHGDADPLVPFQQATLYMDKLKSLGVPAKLSVKKGAAHGWPGMEVDAKELADWFDIYLK